MSEQKKSTHRTNYIDRLIDNCQEHPSMPEVEILKDRLKQEKLNDKIFYQSIKEKIATRQ